MLRKTVQWYRAIYAHMYGYYGPPRTIQEIQDVTKSIYEALKR